MSTTSKVLAYPMTVRDVTMTAEDAWRNLSMKISKKPLLELEPYADEVDYVDFCIALGTLVKERFKTGYVKCTAENLGWQHRSGYKVFECNTDRPENIVVMDFLYSFMPNTDWCATVYSLNKGKGLYFSVSHHDAQGESYYLTPISQRTYERLR